MNENDFRSDAPTGNELKTVVVRGSGRTTADDDNAETKVHRMPINSTTMDGGTTQSSMVQIAKFGLMALTLVLATFAFKGGGTIWYGAAVVSLLATIATFIFTRSKPVKQALRPSEVTLKSKNVSRWSRAYWKEVYRTNPSVIGELLKIWTLRFSVTSSILGFLWLLPNLIYSEHPLDAMVELWNGGTRLIVPLALLAIIGGLSSVLHRRQILKPDMRLVAMDTEGKIQQEFSHMSHMEVKQLRLKLEAQDPPLEVRWIPVFRNTLIRAGFLVSALVFLGAWWPTNRIQKIYAPDVIVQIRTIPIGLSMFDSNGHTFYTPPEGTVLRPNFLQYVYFVNLSQQEIPMKDYDLIRMEAKCKVPGHEELHEACLVDPPQFVMNVDPHALVELNNKGYKVHDLEDEKLWRIGILKRHFVTGLVENTFQGKTAMDQRVWINTWFEKALSEARTAPYANVPGLSKPISMPIHKLDVRRGTVFNLVEGAATSPSSQAGDGGDPPPDNTPPPDKPNRPSDIQ